ncbi:MAG: hypothetical protein J7K13_02055 [Thermoplasmata archaeon]|nr:hypothetical protein [Thermoplasmata archaeon]
MELDESYFGSPKQRMEYKILFYLGLGMLAFGIPLISLGLYGDLRIEGTDILSVMGMVLIGLGSICALPGWLGLREEKQKYGIKRKSTLAGSSSLGFGILSVFTPHAFPLPFIFGTLAIIFSYKAIKQGDNVYGHAGGMCGVIGIIVELYIWILFTVFV